MEACAGDVRTPSQVLSRQAQHPPPSDHPSTRLLGRTGRGPTRKQSPTPGRPAEPPKSEPAGRLGKLLSIASAEAAAAKPLSLRELTASTVREKRALSDLPGDLASEPARSMPLAANSSATGHGLHAAVLRVSASFFVTVRDVDGALCGAVDDMPFALSFRGPEQPVHRVSLLPDGRFQVQWCATTSGKFAIEVLVKGENVQGSPFSCVAENGRIESHTSLVTGAAKLTRVSAGFPLRFGILARDQAGHAANYSPLATSGHAFSCVATLLEPEGGAAEGNAPEEEDVPDFLREEGRGQGPLQERGMVVDKRDGTYNCTFAFRRAGTYKVVVTGEDGGELEGSGFTVVTRAGGMDARFCRLKGEGLDGGTAGQPAHFRVHALDRYGNTCCESGEAERVQAGRFTVLLVPVVSKKAALNRGKSGRTDAIVARTNALTSQREAAMMPVPSAPSAPHAPLYACRRLYRTLLPPSRFHHLTAVRRALPSPAYPAPHPAFPAPSAPSAPSHLLASAPLHLYVPGGGPGDRHRGRPVRGGVRRDALGPVRPAGAPRGGRQLYLLWPHLLWLHLLQLHLLCLYLLCLYLLWHG